MMLETMSLLGSLWVCCMCVVYICFPSAILCMVVKIIFMLTLVGYLRVSHVIVHRIQMNVLIKSADLIVRR